LPGGLVELITLHKPDIETVKLVRSLLEQAEAGELQSLIYSAETVGGHIQNGYTTIHNAYEMVGQLERMKYLLLNLIETNTRAF
jgi:hypothetical protein